MNKEKLKSMFGGFFMENPKDEEAKAIEDLLRKEESLKKDYEKDTKKEKDEKKISVLLNELNNALALISHEKGVWLESAISEDRLDEIFEKLSKGKITTHPVKFAHPKASGANIIKKNKTTLANGYFYSETVSLAKYDILTGHSKNMPGAKFLFYEFENGKCLLDLFLTEKQTIIDLFGGNAAKFQQIVDSLFTENDDETSIYLKQVYFPVDNDYHLLTLLTSTPMIFEWSKRIQDLRFNKNEGDSSINSFSELFTMSVGGTKPVNISYLNSKNGGAVKLLSSSPPELTTREVKKPTENFFSALRLKDYTDSLIRIDNLFFNPNHNVEIKNKLCKEFEDIADHIWSEAVKIREAYSENPGWSGNTNLDVFEASLLDDKDEPDWMLVMSKRLSFWVVKRYNKIFKTSQKFGSIEREVLEKIALERLEMFL